jgi:hypothetical protein
MKKLLLLTIILAGLSCSLFAWSISFAQTDSTQVAKDTCVNLSEYLFLLDYYFTTNFVDKPATVVETVYVPIVKYETEKSYSSKFWEAWQKQREVSQRQRIEDDLERIKEQNDRLLWENSRREQEKRDKEVKEQQEKWEKKMKDLEGR